MGYTVSSSEDGSSGDVYSRVLTPNPVTRTDISLEDGAERGVPTGVECSDGTACPTSPMVKFDDQRGEVAGEDDDECGGLAVPNAGDDISQRMGYCRDY